MFDLNVSKAIKKAIMYSVVVTEHGELVVLKLAIILLL